MAEPSNYEHARDAASVARFVASLAPTPFKLLCPLLKLDPYLAHSLSGQSAELFL